MESTQAVNIVRGRSRLQKRPPLQIPTNQTQANPKKRFLRDLFLGLFFLILLALLMFYAAPADIANLLLFNSYLVFLTLFFLTGFFLLKFILIKTKLAFCITLNLTLLIFFKLQNLTFNYYIFIILGLTSLICLVLHQVEKRLL